MIIVIGLDARVYNIWQDVVVATDMCSLEQASLL